MRYEYAIDLAIARFNQQEVVRMYYSCLSFVLNILNYSSYLLQAWQAHVLISQAGGTNEVWDSLSSYNKDHKIFKSYKLIEGNPTDSGTSVRDSYWYKYGYFKTLASLLVAYYNNQNAVVSTDKWQSCDPALNGGKRYTTEEIQEEDEGGAVQEEDVVEAEGWWGWQKRRMQRTTLMKAAMLLCHHGKRDYFRSYESLFQPLPFDSWNEASSYITTLSSHFDN